MKNLVGWDFPINVDRETGKIKTVSNDENVRKGIKIILNTNNFERRCLPDFGADIRPLVFHEIGSTLLGELERRVRKSIKKWESHIKDLKVDIDLSGQEKGKVAVSINYSTDFCDYTNTIIENLVMNDLSMDSEIKRDEIL